jgi:hypothetical protein
MDNMFPAFGLSLVGVEWFRIGIKNKRVNNLAFMLKMLVCDAAQMSCIPVCGRCKKNIFWCFDRNLCSFAREDTLHLVW